MSDRYFFDQPIQQGRVTLDGPEAHHLIHVMRAAPGEEITLFDGSGTEFPSVVESIRRGEVELSITSRVEVNREPPNAITLGVALPKGERQKWLIEKAVELGVYRLVPLRTARAVAQPVDQAVQRLRRSVVEASKQCGRNRLMQIESARDWSDFLAMTASAPCRLLAHPQSGAHGIEQAASNSNPAEIALAIGPEGGFTDSEVSESLAAGWKLVDLGSRILRVETAALFLVANVLGRRPNP
jgi:16S rRNA (uracil1498-N3)-methyltransferase